MRVGVLIEAQMASPRCPGRPLLSLGPRNVLGHTIRRVRKSKRACELAVLTSSDRIDDDLADYCGLNEIRCFRGPAEHRLRRYALALEHLDWQVAVCLPEHCALIDPELIDQSIEMFCAANADIVCNSLIPSYPRGQELEVIDSRVLKDLAWQVAPGSSDGVESFHFCSRSPAAHRQSLSISDDWSEVSTGIETLEDLDRLRELHNRVGPELFDWDWRQWVHHLQSSAQARQAPLAA